MKEKSKLKSLYKKSLAMELIRLGHDLHHTMRSRKDKKFQVYAFVVTPDLIRDLVKLTTKKIKVRYLHTEILLMIVLFMLLFTSLVIFSHNKN